MRKIFCNFAGNSIVKLMAVHTAVKKSHNQGIFGRRVFIKRKFWLWGLFVLLGAGLVGFGFHVRASAQTVNASVTAAGHSFDVPAKIGGESQGRVYLPLKDTLQNLGFVLSYQNGVLLFQGDTLGHLEVKSGKMFEDGKRGAYRLSGLRMINRSLYVTPKGLSQILNRRVTWNGADKKLLIQEPSGGIPVLMYHYLVPAKWDREPKNNSVLPLEHFEQQMAYLHQAGYYTATLEQLEEHVEGKLQLPPKTVVITFDDGYQNNFIYAYPILRKYGLHAVIFVIGSDIPKRTVDFNPQKSSHLSMAEMTQGKDVFEYHSHTYHLHDKEKLANGKQAPEVLDPELLGPDIKKMKQIIDTPYFCYPFGAFNEQTVNILRGAGYRMAFTVREGSVHPGDDPMILKRVTVKPGYDLAAFEKLLQTQ